MIHKAFDDFSYLEIKDEGVAVVAFMSDACNEEDFEFLKDLSLDFLNNEQDEVGLEISIKLSDILNSTIQNNELINEADEQILDISSKPIFDKTKEELLMLITKIDSLKFKKVD